MAVATTYCTHLGKPEKFNNDERDFVMWARRLQNFVVSVYPYAREAMALAAESSGAVVVEDLELEVGTASAADLEELNAQLYTCVLGLTWGEAADLIVGAGDGEGPGGMAEAA